MQIILRNFVVVTRRCFSDGNTVEVNLVTLLIQKILKNHQQKGPVLTDTDADIDLENSGNETAINPVIQAPPTDDADENDSVWTLLVLNESGDFDFQFDCSECGKKHIDNAKKPIDFFYLMFKPVLWRILVEETN